LFGVVEGFYGRPWSAGQRHILFGWLGEGGLTAYMYAPKDDAKHRAVWREPYEAAEAAELTALIRDCRQHGLRFVYALSPGLDIGFTRTSDLEALRAKLEQVHGLGACDFAILFDDINPNLAEADRQRFGTAAAAQASWATRCSVGRAAGTPTPACSSAPRSTAGGLPRLRSRFALPPHLGEQLSPEVHVLWTGPEIISEAIPVASIRELQGVLRRKPMLWDNLHANDYDLRRLYLGPYAGRAGALMAEISGILQNRTASSRRTSWPCGPSVPMCAIRRAMRRKGLCRSADGVAARVQESGRARFHPGRLELAADVFHLPTEHGELALRYLADLRVILHGPPNAWGETAARVAETTRQIAVIYEKCTELADRGLMYALYPQLWEIKENAILVGEWMRWRQKNPEAKTSFTSTGFRPKIYRGGFTAAFERLMPMDAEGRFIIPA
jgi:protein O-GlcNAcase/histone acetyltransferase